VRGAGATACTRHIKAPQGCKLVPAPNLARCKAQLASLNARGAQVQFSVQMAPAICRLCKLHRHAASLTVDTDTHSGKALVPALQR
jgi:hypothetical protein